MYQEIVFERNEKQKHAINDHFVITLKGEMPNKKCLQQRHSVNRYNGNK